MVVFSVALWVLTGPVVGIGFCGMQEITPQLLQLPHDGIRVVLKTIFDIAWFLDRIYIFGSHQRGP